MGKSWHITASPFPAVHGGQRHVVLRLAEGPILFIGFANGNEQCESYGDDGCVVNVTVPTAGGARRAVFGAEAGRIILIFTCQFTRDVWRPFELI